MPKFVWSMLALSPCHITYPSWISFEILIKCFISVFFPHLKEKIVCSLSISKGKVSYQEPLRLYPSWPSQPWEVGMQAWDVILGKQGEVLWQMGVGRQKSDLTKGFVILKKEIHNFNFSFWVYSQLEKETCAALAAPSFINTQRLQWKQTAHGERKFCS